MKTGLVVGTLSPDRYTGEDFLNDVASFGTNDIDEIKSHFEALIMLKANLNAKEYLQSLKSGDVSQITRVMGEIEKLAPVAYKELHRLQTEIIPKVAIDEGTADDRKFIQMLLSYSTK